MSEGDESGVQGHVCPAKYATVVSLALHRSAEMPRRPEGANQGSRGMFAVFASQLHHSVLGVARRSKFQQVEGDLPGVEGHVLLSSSVL